MSRPDKDTYYLDIARAVSKRSTCLRRHYGCVIVKDDAIIATGYNGSPKGELNCCDIGECKRANCSRYSGYDVCPAVHAEQNALIYADRMQLKGATLYLACEEKILKQGLCGSMYASYKQDEDPIPCNICMNMIKNSGISKVVNRSGVVWGL